MLHTAASNSEAFYAAALLRIRRFMMAVAFLLSGGAWVRFGWRVALGFAIGCAIAYINFHWLKRVVSALADKVTATGQPQSSTGIVLRFLLRYVLMALAAYAIFTSSSASLYGLFAGLFLPAGGIACEAAYEVYAAVARGM
jgi:small-conductance mechanosensitive channel